MDLFLGIGDMPIYNFDKVLKTNNLSYLVLGWNERSEITPPEQVQTRWDEIYNEYCKRTANNEALTFYSLSSEIGYLEMRYTAIYALIENMCEQYKEELGKRLNKWGIPFNIQGSIKPQTELLKRHLRIAEQNIGIKTRKLKELKGDEGNEGSSIIQQKIKLERITSIKIDLKQTSVEEWIEIHNEAKEIAQQQKAASNG